MFNFKDEPKVKVANPIKITKNSMIEFSAGFLANTGLYEFKKIIEFKVGERIFARYLLHSKVENEEYVFEAFVGNDDVIECYLYRLYDTVPFSEDFLDVAGQLYFTTPEGLEFIRTVMPDNGDRIDGIEGTIQVYDIDSDRIEVVTGVSLWDYQRDADERLEYLNIEMSKGSGIFKIFTGELIEEIFYKIYLSSQDNK